ncbi:hypothetical protein [Paraferrimonas haliotis]|uniref:Uncharacterized protein n=1 Tax=Paraferrimonas haliotis TaxID=2013866 RepID=A0AA37WWG0_9GAMM|nr:hypothetical protein [Paraferrimonas haliotis]GLS83447.1 hypothetical protein GCM10007894_14240 [Paraferrimonas haliotis]
MLSDDKKIRREQLKRSAEAFRGTNSNLLDVVQVHPKDAPKLVKSIAVSTKLDSASMQPEDTVLNASELLWHLGYEHLSEKLQEVANELNAYRNEDDARKAQERRKKQPLVDYQTIAAKLALHKVERTKNTSSPYSLSAAIDSVLNEWEQQPDLRDEVKPSSSTVRRWAKQINRN